MIHLRNKRKFNLWNWIWIIPLISGFVIEIISITNINKTNNSIPFFSKYSIVLSGILIFASITFICYIIPRAINHSRIKLKEFKEHAKKEDAYYSNNNNQNEEKIKK